MTQALSDLATELITDWRARAACSGFPNEIFFPSSEAPERAVQKATSVCVICPVTEECLEYAFETNQRAGIWGGTTERQRKSLRRKWLAERRRSA